MTIKQNGGIFGRNPTFNNVTVEGEFTSSSLNIDSNKLYVDPNNVRVGINTDSPDTIFEIRGSDPILTIRDTDTGSATANATLRLAETGASDTLDSYWDIKATNGFLHFIDNWNEGGGTGTRISFLDGGGIAFNGDTAAANALSDYEEGSWTPAGNGVTLTSASGHYTKVGRLVHVHCQISFPTNSDTNNANIYGLPYTVGQQSTGHIGYNTFGSGTNKYFAAFSAGTHLRLYDDNGNNSTNATFSGKSVWITTTYGV